MQPYTVVVMSRELPRPNKERVCGAKGSPGKDWAPGMESEPAAGLEQKTGPCSGGTGCRLCFMEAAASLAMSPL